MTANRVFSYDFAPATLQALKADKRYRNWPIIYILENRKHAYIGETNSAIRRIATHLKDERRKGFDKLYLIKDEKFNKSATLDLESTLIEYISGDGTYTLQNSNRGLRNHNYFDREYYEDLFREIWDELKAHNVVRHSIRDIKNSDLFKYSPYKALTDDQTEIVEKLEEIIQNHTESRSIVRGEPGSGKTILAIYLVKYLLSDESTAGLKIGIVLPQTSLRETIRQIFRNVDGLKSKMVLGPNDVVNDTQQFDVLIVDEAHRLTQRRNLANYSTFDKAAGKLGLDSEVSDQLDWILQKSAHTILLYDGNQSVKPSDVAPSRFKELEKQANKFVLESQMRVLAGDRYTGYIDAVLRQKAPEICRFQGYDLRLYTRLDRMVADIQELNEQHGLCRLVAGFAWEWKSRENPDIYDIKIENCRLKWNATTKNWINSPNAHKEVGCIHTVQGYDMNYTAVIIGPEITLERGQLRFHPERYKDRYGKHSSLTPTEMVDYILNIYKTLMTRGIRGTFVYACDPDLSAYLSRYIPVYTPDIIDQAAESTPDYGK
ncbi:DNA/RNA helicase domain-containing protein [Spirochaeta dissipatitropha]